MDDVGLDYSAKVYDYLEYIIDTWEEGNTGPYKGMASKYCPVSYKMDPGWRDIRMPDHD